MSFKSALAASQRNQRFRSQDSLLRNMEMARQESIRDFQEEQDKRENTIGVIGDVAQLTTNIGTHLENVGNTAKWASQFTGEGGELTEKATLLNLITGSGYRDKDNNVIPMSTLRETRNIHENITNFGGEDISFFDAKSIAESGNPHQGLLNYMNQALKQSNTSGGVNIERSRGDGPSNLVGLDDDIKALGNDIYAKWKTGEISDAEVEKLLIEQQSPRGYQWTAPSRPLG